MTKTNHNTWNEPSATPVLRMYHESVVYRFLGWIHIKNKYPFDDRVKDLRGKPLAMVFYNQRAIFFGFGLICCLILTALSFRLPSSAESQLTIKILWTFWAAGVVVTVALHPIFRTKLTKWSISNAPNEFPPMFD